MLQQPEREILQIEQPLAEVRIADLLHAGPRIVLDLRDGGFRRQAAADGFPDTTDPAAVLGDHSVRPATVEMFPTSAELRILLAIGFQPAKIRRPPDSGRGCQSV